MHWIVPSIVLSVVLTVLLNLAIRLWPGAADRGAERMDDWLGRQGARHPTATGGEPRVIVPWKAMLIGSLVLTVLLNVLIRLF